ncbi:MAG: NUDIX domain-containing protein [Clostridiales bacterium]|nr:NUDIX domain-containing protein [Clostridiales bacterium]
MAYDCYLSKENYYFRYRTGAIILHDRKMLFVQNDLGGYYYMIGGAVHLGENSRDCIEREVFEETGVACKAVRTGIICENFFAGDRLDERIKDKICHVLEFYYLMEAPEGSIFQTETDTGEKLVWLPLDELDKYDVRPIMLKTKLKEAIDGGHVLHVINNDIDRTIS